jgi:hypothetical protein
MSPPSILDDVSLYQDSLEEGFAICAISNKVEIDDEATHLSPKIDLEFIKHRKDGDLVQINISVISLHSDNESDMVVVLGLGGEVQNQESLLIED